ncbi:MAG: GWxTD domain-containing protein [Candidatus Eisenbacteria bacterium]
MRRAAEIIFLLFAFVTRPCGAELPAHAVYPERPAFSARVVPLLEESRSIAAVRIEVPYRELSFRKMEEGLAARFDLIVLVFQGERQIAGDIYPETIQIPDRAVLRERQGRYSREFRLPVPPGLYTVEVALSEPGSGHEGRLRLGLAIEPVFPGQVRLSPLLFGPCGIEGSIADLFFDSRMVTQVLEPEQPICVYAELMHPELAAAQVYVHWSLWREEGGGEMILEGRQDYPAGEGSTRLSWPLSIQGLWLESYRLEVVATAEGKQARGRATLGLVVESDAALDQFFRETLDALGYIAEEDEVEELRMAAPEERRSRWAAFWALRDPTPDSAGNEYKEEFFDRLRYANAQFSLVRPGWRTDRGRIYIRHGEPDMVDRRPFQAGSFPTEIWHYDHLGLRLVFVDRNGFGDYVLVSEDW